MKKLLPIWKKWMPTNHSWWPCDPSWFKVYTAITRPVPRFVAANVFSSIQPLKTRPKPPSPNIQSGRKLRVAFLRSMSLKFFRFDDCRTSGNVFWWLAACDLLLFTERTPLLYLDVFVSLLPADRYDHMNAYNIYRIFHARKLHWQGEGESEWDHFCSYCNRDNEKKKCWHIFLCQNYFCSWRMKTWFKLWKRK